MNTQARKRFDKLSSKGKAIPPYVPKAQQTQHSADCASVKTWDIPEYGINPETKFYCNCGADERWETTIPKLEQRCELATEIINDCLLNNPNYNVKPVFKASLDRELCIVNIEMDGWPETEFYLSPTESVQETIDENNDVAAPAWNLYIDDDQQGSPLTIGCALAHLYQWDKTQSIQGECLMLSENTENV